MTVCDSCSLDTLIEAYRGHQRRVRGLREGNVEADLAMKEAALQRVADPGPKPPRFHASDRLITFLQAL